MARHLTVEEVLSVIADVEYYMQGSPRRERVGHILTRILLHSTGLSFECPVGTRIVRAVKMDKGEGFPNSLSRVTYPPVPRLNRANTPSRPVFYGQPISPSGYYALFPEIPELEVGDVIAVSTWKSKKDFRLIPCGFVDCPGVVGGNELSASEMVLKEFLQEEFRRKFRTDFPYNYWITSEVAEFCYEWESTTASANAGVAYASVHDETVFNWSIKGEFIDENFFALKVDMVKINDIETNEDNVKYKYDLISTTDRFESKNICW